MTGPHDTTRFPLRCTTRFPLQQNAITWICDECGQPIADGAGGLGVDVAASIERGRPSERADRAATPVEWVAVHLECNSGGTPGYWIAVDRLRTATQLLDWSAHLAGKRWASGTDWWRVVRRVALRQLGVNA